MKLNSEDIFDGFVRGTIAPELVSFDGIYGQEVPDTPKDIRAAITTLKAALNEYQTAHQAVPLKRAATR